MRITRTYEVTIANEAEVAKRCEREGWSFGDLADTCTRALDAGEHDGQLWLIDNEGSGALEWADWEDTCLGGLLYGPVDWSCEELDVEIG